MKINHCPINRKIIETRGYVIGLKGASPSIINQISCFNVLSLLHHKQKWKEHFPCRYNMKLQIKSNPIWKIFLPMLKFEIHMWFTHQVWVNPRKKIANKRVCSILDSAVTHCALNGKRFNWYIFNRIVSQLWYNIMFMTFST
jgi:hypothetical protein